MDTKYCQCCGMPMGENEVYGTEADGSKSVDYCNYCYENGEITFKGTMDEMIEFCIPPMVDAKVVSSVEEARQMMKQFFPTLKYWKQQSEKI